MKISDDSNEICFAVRQRVDIKDIKEVTTRLVASGYTYVLIRHLDEPTEKEPNPVGVHYHGILTAPNGTRKRKSTWINLIQDLFRHPQDGNTDGVEVDTVDSTSHLLKYFLHLGYDDKLQYPISDLVTNWKTPVENYILFGDETIEMTFPNLYKLARESFNKEQFLSKIGLKNYTRYHCACDLVIKSVFGCK